VDGNRFECDGATRDSLIDLDADFFYHFRPHSELALSRTGRISSGVPVTRVGTERRDALFHVGMAVILRESLIEPHDALRAASRPAPSSLPFDRFIAGTPASAIVGNCRQRRVALRAAHPERTQAVRS
jgi:hypothetical protein